MRETDRLSRKQWMQVRKRRNRDLIQKLKMERGCADCGYNKHPAALDFDHLPEAGKLYQVSTMTMASIETLLAELAKCEVVCANCHRIRTHDRATAARPPVGVITPVPKTRRTNPLQEARAFARQIDVGQPQHLIAARANRSQSFVSNRLKLLRLPAPMLEALESSYTKEATDPWPIMDAIAFVNEAKGDQTLMLAAYELRHQRPDLSPAALIRICAGAT